MREQVCMHAGVARGIDFVVERKKKKKHNCIRWESPEHGSNFGYYFLLFSSRDFMHNDNVPRLPKPYRFISCSPSTGGKHTKTPNTQIRQMHSFKCGCRTGRA